MTKNRITATEARENTEQYFDRVVEHLLEQCYSNIRKGSFEGFSEHDYSFDARNWTLSMDKRNEVLDRVQQELEANGYLIEIKEYTGSPYVSHRIKIKW